MLISPSAYQTASYCYPDRIDFLSRNTEKKFQQLPGSNLSIILMESKAFLDWTSQQALGFGAIRLVFYKFKIWWTLRLGRVLIALSFW